MISVSRPHLQRKRSNLTGFLASLNNTGPVLPLSTLIKVSKLLGPHMSYYPVPCNARLLESFRHSTQRDFMNSRSFLMYITLRAFAFKYASFWKSTNKQGSIVRQLKRPSQHNALRMKLKLLLLPVWMNMTISWDNWVTHKAMEWPLLFLSVKHVTPSPCF